jgi:hypothetical protein
MTVQTFRDLLSDRPFKPFKVIMSSGKSYEVRHPEMAWVLKNDLLIGICDDDDDVPAEFKTCSMLHINAIEPLTAAKTEG